ncbi:FAD-dependent monooxygenase [Marinomonas algicola]|uniref:FAD-dependent monooxygenase n=1 Tax=Marinomonas algicola TaxID=2773454 RepID=UPI00174B2EFD|nr:FAD-dependent monooxygenase [Marinomonas algicola]
MKQKIVIAGAGIGGLCAALSFAQRGFSVQVFEQSSQLGEVGAGLQMSPNAMKVLEALGLSEQVNKVAFVPQNAVLRHYQKGSYFLKAELGKVAEQRYQSPYLHLHRADLHALLLDAATDIGVDIRLNSRLISFTQDDHQVRITLEDGTTDSASLLIGADGIRSNVLAQLQTVDDFNHDVNAPVFTGQVAWRGVVPTDKLPPHLIKPDATVWVGPGRHLVTYYLRGGKLINFVAVEERKEWASESWNTQGDAEHLKRAFSGWHPEVTQLLESVEETFLWGLFGREPLAKWHLKRVVLLGDACHPMLPFMAQGAAMALEDAYVLAKELSSTNMQDQQRVQHALKRYTLVRLPRASKVQAMSRDNADLYHMKGGALGRIRLNMINMASKALPSLVSSKLDPLYGYDVTK